MKIHFGFIGLLSFSLFSSLTFGQIGQSLPHKDSRFSRQAELKTHLLVPAQSTEVEMNGGKKNLAVGAVLSVLVPGAGELYAGSWLKGILFMGVEAGLWIGYGHYSGKGNEWEDVFHEYADTHWDEEKWREWMTAHPDYSAQTHTLPSTKTQQYYEMIGKYDQFMAGWDDYIDGGPALTENRNYYEGLRHNSNVQLKRASYCVMLAMGNRLLSVFDTVWTIRRINQQIDSRMRIGLIQGERNWLPCLTWSVRW